MTISPITSQSQVEKSELEKDQVLEQRITQLMAVVVDMQCANNEKQKQLSVLKHESSLDFSTTCELEEKQVALQDKLGELQKLKLEINAQLEAELARRIEALAPVRTLRAQVNAASSELVQVRAEIVQYQQLLSSYRCASENGNNR